MASLPVISDAAEAFAVFASELNFTRAAERLFISQPALHTKLKKFGESVGAPLYENQRGRLVLTDQGRALAGLISVLQTQRDDFALTLERERREPVVLAAGEGAFLYLLGDVVRDLARVPGPGLRLFTADAPATLAAVLDGSADVGVGVFADVPSSIKVVDIARVAQAVACPANHRLARRKRIKLSDLDGEPLVVPPTGRPMHTELLAAFREHEIDLAIAVEARGWELALRFVSMNVGCAIVNDFVGERRGVRLIPLQDLPAVTYQVVMKNRSDLAVRAVFDAVARSGHDSGSFIIR